MINTLELNARKKSVLIDLTTFKISTVSARHDTDAVHVDYLHFRTDKKWIR